MLLFGDGGAYLQAQRLQLAGKRLKLLLITSARGAGLLKPRGDRGVALPRGASHGHKLRVYVQRALLREPRAQRGRLLRHGGALRGLRAQLRRNVGRRRRGRLRLPQPLRVRGALPRQLRLARRNGLFHHRRLLRRARALFRQRAAGALNVRAQLGALRLQVADLAL
jgi:hypothetical protein